MGRGRGRGGGRKGEGVGEFFNLKITYIRISSVSSLAFGAIGS